MLGLGECIPTTKNMPTKSAYIRTRDSIFVDCDSSMFVCSPFTHILRIQQEHIMIFSLTFSRLLNLILLLLSFLHITHLSPAMPRLLFASPTHSIHSSFSPLSPIMKLPPEDSQRSQFRLLFSFNENMLLQSYKGIRLTVFKSEKAPLSTSILGLIQFASKNEK